MATKLLFNQYCVNPTTPRPSSLSKQQAIHISLSFKLHQNGITTTSHSAKRKFPVVAFSAAMQPLDLTEDNIEAVLAEARVELAQLFDSSVGITGQAELAELDGPFVKLRLRGKFWHKRSTVIARLENYLKQRIPEILEVDIEDEKQLDDSPASF
ncbi:NifU-like protein 3 chloroplastic [Bienertia sinuspersici]